MNSLKSLITACIAAGTLSVNAQSSDIPVNMGPEIVDVLSFDGRENKDNNLCAVLLDSVSVRKFEGENNLKENSKIKFEASIEAQTCLYDNFTFEQYSENSGMHFLGSIVLPMGKNTNISLSESVYYTPEKNNPTCENNITDLVLSYDFGKFSVGGGLQLSQYFNQKSLDMFSIYSILNYSLNDKFSICVVPYRPLFLDWKKISDFYVLSKSEYKISDDKEIFIGTMTACTNNWKTLFGFGFSSSIGNNLSVEFSTIPESNGKIGVIPEGIQGTLRYTFGN